MFFSAQQAILKSLLEAEREVSLVCGPAREAFAALFEEAATEPGGSLLRRHQMTVTATPTARRAVALAMRAIHSDRSACVLIPNDELDQTMAALDEARAAKVSRAEPGGGGAVAPAMCIVLEDHPQRVALTCPRQASQRLEIPCIEPMDLPQLRDAIEQALRLSRAGACPVSVIVHSLVLRSGQTLEVRPNRMLQPEDRVVLKRRTRPRWTESGGVLRLARRMELNRARCMPSPGERAPVGFITIGPAHQALMHLISVLRLHGRVPVLQMGLVNPMDEARVSRFLSRCERVIVLEPRPGVMELCVMSVAESMRRVGEVPGTVWGRTLPADREGMSPVMRSDDDLHPSILVRRIAHLLHMVRPTLQVPALLAEEPPPLPAPLPPRGAEFGSAAALTSIRRLLTEVDQWLRDQAMQEPAEQGEAKPRGGARRTALVIDGVEPAPGLRPFDRLVAAELMDARRFQDHGAAVLAQAARDERPWIIIICELERPDALDMERLARGMVPADSAERVRIELGNFNDRPALLEQVQQASLGEAVTVLVVRDGPPPRFDPLAVERAFAEVDRLGFEPQERLVRRVDEACDIGWARGPQEEESHDLGAGVGEGGGSSAGLLQSSFALEPAARRSMFRAKIQPLWEEIEVTRSRPPAWRWGGGGAAGAARLQTPAPLHGQRAQWRAHIAGWRGAAPGLSAWVLCEAGRNMGYHVSAVHDPTVIAPGVRALAQVLFTRSAASPEHGIGAVVPFGEADLLLGLDVHETMRGIDPAQMLRVAAPTRTWALVNVALPAFARTTGVAGVRAAAGATGVAGMPGVEGRAEFAGTARSAGTRESSGAGGIAAPHAMKAAMARVTREEGCWLEEYAAVCRAWFHTERVVDMVMLGAAYQRGLIPVSPEAIETALARAERRGFGRSVEAFGFGRRLAVEPRLGQRALSRRPQGTEAPEDLARIIRRTGLSVRRSAMFGRRRAAQFQRLLAEWARAMPGLAETAAGREARRDFVAALYRCLEWGGPAYATRYAELIVNLYRADRGDRGRAVTRNAILPLAEVMLLRDPIYMASMATSPEQRRLLRQRLNIKRARGDSLSRRYLTRFELVAARRRFRADVRTSDWPAKFARAARHVLPQRWRGTQRERALREIVIDLVVRARSGCRVNYEGWHEVMRRLHHHAIEDRLREMAVSELRMLTDPEALPAVARAAPPEPATPV